MSQEPKDTEQEAIIRSNNHAQEEKINIKAVKARGSKK